jgi:hypothetical protein
MKEQLLVHSNTALSLDTRADDVHALQVEGDPHHICRHILILQRNMNRSRRCFREPMLRRLFMQTCLRTKMYEPIPEQIMTEKARRPSVTGGA